jgi:hypothetical protein
VAMTGDCKSPLFRVRRFESYLRHQINSVTSVADFMFLWYNTIHMSDYRRKKVMELATSLIGKPSILYRNPEEGMSPEKGFDCSGFVSYVLKQAGLYVPDYIGQDGHRRPVRHANEYFDYYGIPIPEKKFAITGDLIFFSRTGASPQHMGILTSHETYIHSPGKDSQFVEEKEIEYTEIPANPNMKRQFYFYSPIGYKALATVLEQPTIRRHQKLVD